MSLNLLQDFTDHNFKTIKAIELMVISQIQYMKNKKFEEMIRGKTAKVIKKNSRLRQEYREERESYFIQIGKKKPEIKCWSSLSDYTSTGTTT